MTNSNKLAGITAAPSMRAELLARRARDAEVEALVAAGSELISAFDGPDGYERACKLHLAVESTRSALAPFAGAKT